MPRGAEPYPWSIKMSLITDMIFVHVYICYSEEMTKLYEGYRSRDGNDGLMSLQDRNFYLSVVTFHMKLSFRLVKLVLSCSLQRGSRGSCNQAGLTQVPAPNVYQ